VVFDPSLSAAVVLNTYIGGVRVFLGPALGAALMTLFGYSISDLSQSWLLYQGMLFALVMMFMPSGLAGLFEESDNLPRRFGTAPVVRFLGFGVAAAVLCIAGRVFLVELLQHMFSQDYRALATVAQPWPPVALFWRLWSPVAPATWLVPGVSIGVGAAFL